MLFLNKNSESNFFDLQFLIKFPLSKIPTKRKTNPHPAIQNKNNLQSQNCEKIPLIEWLTLLSRLMPGNSHSTVIGCWKNV